MASGPKTQRLILALGLLLSLPFAFTPVSNPDLPWHLSAARWMAGHGALPRADFLSWTRNRAPWLDFEWGTQLLYYGLHRPGGLGALWLFKAGVFAALLGVFVALLSLWRLPPAWTGLALLPLTLSLVPNLDVRPENLTLLFCLLQLYALEAFRLQRPGPLPLALSPRPLALIHFVMYALWANLHGGFVAGLTLGGLYILGEAVRLLLPRVHDPRAQVDLKPLLPWLGIGAAAAAGTLVNPFGPKVYTVALDHYRQLDLLAAHIQEWKEPSIYEMSLWPYWAMVVFCFAVFAWHYARTRRTPFAHLFTLLFFGLSSSSYTRNTAFFCLWAYPLTLLQLGELESPPLWRRVRGWVLGAGTAALAAAAYTVMQPPGTFRIVHDDVHEPAGACDFLRREQAVLSGLRLYNPWEWGGYLGWVLHPAYPVFVDGRYLFHDFLVPIARAQQDPDAWNRFLSEQGVDLVLIQNRKQWIPDPDADSREPLWRPIARWFFPKTRWALLYWDEKALVFARRERVSARWLARHEYKALFPGDSRWLRLQVVRRRVPMTAVESEARRFLGETGDRVNAAKLQTFLLRLRQETSGKL